MTARTASASQGGVANELRKAALAYAQATNTEAFMVPIGIGSHWLVFGSKEQIAKLLDDGAMTAYRGKD